MSSFNQGIQQAPADRVWTPEEISMLLRDAMAMRSLSVNMNEDSLMAEMELVEEALNPLKE